MASARSRTSTALLHSVVLLADPLDYLESYLCALPSVFTGAGGFQRADSNMNIGHTIFRILALSILMPPRTVPPCKDLLHSFRDTSPEQCQSLHLLTLLLNPHRCLCIHHLRHPCLSWRHCLMPIVRLFHHSFQYLPAFRLRMHQNCHLHSLLLYLRLMHRS